jgi:O-antigen ligase
MSYIDPLLIFFLLYAALAWRSLPWALSFLAFALPAYLVRFSFGPFPSSALEIMILICVVRWGVLLWQSESWRDRLGALTQTALFWPGVSLSMAALVACAFSPDLLSGLGIWRAYFVQPFLIYLIVVDVIRSQEEQSRLLAALGVSVFVLTVLAIVQYFTGSWLPTVADTRRATGPFTSPNALGLYVVPIALLHLGLLFDRLRPLTARYFSGAVVAAAALSTMLAVSRGAMAAFAVGAVFILYRRWSKVKTFAVALLCGALLLALPATRQEIVDLVGFQAASGQSRLALYKGSVELLKQHPFAGTGLAGFGAAFESVRPAEYTEKLIYPHNIFLNFWTETGLLGLVVVLWIIVVVVARLSFARDSDPVWRDAFTAAFLAILAHGLIDVPYFKNDLAVLTWMMLALLACHFDRRPVLRV